MIAEKASAAAAYGGSGTAIYFGFTPGEWQAIGVIGGLIVGLLGLVVTAFFKYQHLKIAREKGKADTE